eukprot:418809_1
MASPKKTSSPSELKVWQHLLLLDLMRRKDALQQHIMDARQDLVRRITVLDHSDACLKKGFNLLEQEIRNHPVFAGIKTEEPIPTINNITSLPPIPTIDTITTESLPPNTTNIPPIAVIKTEEPIPTINNITSLPPIPTIDTITTESLPPNTTNIPPIAVIKTEEPIPTINNITSLPPIPTIDTITTASLPPNITNIPPIADGPLLDDIIHIKDEEPVLNDVTHRTSKSKPTPFQNVRKYKQGKKIRMNKDNKLKQKILKNHNQYRRLKTFQFDLDETIKGIHDAGRKKTYKCPFFTSCQFARRSRWSVCEHVRGHHASRPYKCDVCGKTYKR